MKESVGLKLTARSVHPLLWSDTNSKHHRHLSLIRPSRLFVSTDRTNEFARPIGSIPGKTHSSNSSVITLTCTMQLSEKANCY